MKLAIVSPYITAAFGRESLYNVQSFGLAGALAEKGVETRIFTCRKPGDPRERALDNTNGLAKVIYLSLNVKVPQIPFMNPLLASYIRHGHFDVVLVSEDFSPTSVYVSLVRRKAVSKLAVFQGLYRIPSSVAGRAYFNMYDQFILRQMVRNVDIVIAKTNACASFMRNRGYSNVQTIPVGIDTRQFSPKDRVESRNRLGLDESSRVLLYVGKVIPGRDVLTCVRALRILRRRSSDIWLVIAGDGTDLARVRLEAESSKLTDRLIIIPEVPNRDLPFIYSAADVTLLPMHRNTVFTFGMVIPESIACGVPVVSAPVPAALDHIIEGWTGSISMVSDGESFARHIAVALEATRKGNLTPSHVRSYALETLDWRVVSRKYMRALLDLGD